MWPLLGRALVGVAFTAYPVLVWYGLGAWGPRVLALVMLAVVVPSALIRLRHCSRYELASLAILPLVTVVALSLAALLNSRGYVLLVPVAINAALLLAFGSTLRRDATPMIERFARIQLADLNGPQIAWCRLWTRIWCAFFVLNGGTALVLALNAPLSWWALYNGLLAYGLIGTLLGTEWWMRRRRFAPPGHESTDSGERGLHWQHEEPREQDGLTTAVSYSRLPMDYHYFEGHFRGHPVLAGVVQLHEMVLPCVRRVRPDLGALKGLSRLKFPDRIEPGQAIDVRLHWKGSALAVSFEICREGRRCSQGLLTFADPGTTP